MRPSWVRLTRRSALSRSRPAGNIVLLFACANCCGPLDCERAARRLDKMSRLPRIFPLVVLLYLLCGSSSFADTLQVSFTATIGLFPAGETVSGSFLWNTETQGLS